MKKVTNPLIYIQWCDAAAVNSDWQSIKAVMAYAKEDESWLVHEVGFVLEETDEYLLLSSQITDGGNAGNCIKIPTTWIRKRVELTEYLKK